MKRFSLLQTILLGFPVLLLFAAAAYFSRMREKERQFYAQPFEPRLIIERSKVPGDASVNLFGVVARCVSAGGSGQSYWLMRAQLFDVSGKKPREIWNSQKLLSSKSLFEIMRGGGSYTTFLTRYPNRPSMEADFDWRFQRRRPQLSRLKMIVEAVALLHSNNGVPIQNQLGKRKISINEATPAQIAAARQQSGARYFRESLLLLARDDNKHHFSERELTQNLK